MTVIRAALTGDLHVNLPRRSEEAFRIAHWIGEDAKRRGVHIIGVGGDFVDGPMTERERAKVIDLATFYASIAPTVFADGNHEIELALRNALGKIPNVIVEDGAGLHLVETDAGPVAVVCVSFPKKAALLAAVNENRRREAEANKTAYQPVAGEEADQIAGQALQDIFRGMGLKVDQLNPGIPTIALVHGTIKGSKIQPDDQPDRPLGLDISLADLTLAHADFYCTPHIHLAQSWDYDGVTIATPSCPFYADYGEAKHEKGYLYVEFDTQIVNARPGECVRRDNLGDKVWMRVPTPAIPMLLIEARYAGAGEWIWLSKGDITPIPTLEQVEEQVKGADVRFRFHFSSDRRKEATEAASGIAGLFRVDGAVNVTLDPIQTPTTRARIPTLTTTVRLEDKLKLYWKSIGFEPSPEREAALIDMLHQIQDDAAKQGLSMGTVGRAAPTLHKFRGKGLFKFDGEIEVDFNQLAGPLTAIIAPNETGKTILVQLMGPGLLYGTTPTRGSLDDLATDNGAFIEAEFSMAGSEYKITQVASTKSASGRTSYPGTVSVLKDGKPELGNKSAGGRDDYKLWASKNLLPQNVYDAVICQSGTDSVIDMKDGPRVELLLRVLGLEIYEALAKMARDNAAAVATALTGVRERIQEIGEADVPALRAALTTMQEQKVNLVDLPLFNAEEFLVQARLRANKVEKLLAEHDTQVARLGELAAQVTAKRTSRTQIETRINVGRELTSQRVEIERAVADIAACEAEIAALPTSELQVELTKAQANEAHIASDKAALEKRIASLREQVDQISQRLDALREQRRATSAVVADAETIRKAVAEKSDYEAALQSKREENSKQKVREVELAGQARDIRSQLQMNSEIQNEVTRQINRSRLIVEKKARVLESVAAVANRTKDIETAEGEIARYREEIESLNGALSSSKDVRILGLRSGITTAIGVAKGDEITGSRDDVLVGTLESAIEHDDDLEAEAEDAPARLDAAKAGMAASEEALRQYRRSLEGHREEAAHLPEIERAEQVLAENTDALTRAQTLQAEAETKMEELIEASDLLAVEMGRTQADIRWLNEQIEQLEPLVSRSEMLATAATKLQGIVEQIAVAEEDLRKIETTLGFAQKELTDLGLAADDVALHTESLRSKIATTNAAVTEMRTQIESLHPAANKFSFLTAALAAEETLLHQLSQVDEELETLERNHDQLEHQVDEAIKTLPKPVDLTEYEKAVTDARSVLAETQTRIALAEKELKDAEAKEARRQDLAAQVRGLEEQVSNWTALGQHLGKDGLQKEEISAAGPQLTATTNELLRAAGDTRHTVSIETERLHSNKKQTIPCLDIMVFDSVEQISKESRRLSDAGKILVGEPFGLALVVLGCQRAGITAPTIFRDEATGVMDEVNAPRYIAELRKFSEILDARVVFISQQAAIQELADSAIRITAEGRITVT